MRECLQEADVHWTSSYNTDTNNNDCNEEFNEDNRFSDGRVNLVGNSDKVNSFFIESAFIGIKEGFLVTTDLVYL